MTFMHACSYFVAIVFCLFICSRIFSSSDEEEDSSTQIQVTNVNEISTTQSTVSTSYTGTDPKSCSLEDANEDHIKSTSISSKQTRGRKKHKLHTLPCPHRAEKLGMLFFDLESTMPRYKIGKYGFAFSI